MSYNLGQVCAAPEIQLQLDDHFRKCKPANKPFSIGTLMFLMSDVNKDSVLQEQITKNTQKRIVQLTWLQRILKEATGDACVIDCSGGPKQGNNCESYTIDEGTDIQFNIDPRDWEQNQEPIGFWAAKIIQSHMNALTGRLNEKVVADISNNFGDFALLNNPGPTVTTTCTANVATDLSLIEDVAFNSLDSGFCSTPWVFGWGEALRYLRRVDAGCCADPLGIDLGKFASTNDFTFIADRTVEEQIGTDHFFALDIGAVQFLHWNQFVGPWRAVDGGNYVQGIIIDRFTGLPIDYYAEVDCGLWRLQLKLCHKTVFQPATMYAVGDEHEAVNGVHHYLIANAGNC